MEEKKDRCLQCGGDFDKWIAAPHGSGMLPACTDFPDCSFAQRKSQNTPKNIKLDLIDRSNLKVGEVLGEGGFASVYKGYWNASQCAIKIVNTSKKNRFKKDAMIQEARIHSALHHPHIVNFFGISIDEGEIWLVMALIESTGLNTFINNSNNVIPIKDKLQLCLQICDAIRYLHDEKGFIHNDIKPYNVLIQQQKDKYISYIYDFGISRYIGFDSIDLDTNYTTNAAGTLNYMAPECLEKVRLGSGKGKFRKPTFKSDIWSLGSVLFELLTGEELYEDYYEWTNFKLKGKMPPTFNKVPSFAKEILERCLGLDCEERPTAKELVSFFQEFAFLPEIKKLYTQYFLPDIDTTEFCMTSFALPKDETLLSHELSVEDTHRITDSIFSKSVPSPLLENANSRYVINRSELTVQEFLGKGAFGSVHKGLWRNSTCAIKMCTSNMKRLFEERMFEEARIQCLLRHPRIVSCYGISEGKKGVWIVLQLIENCKTLLDLLKSKIVIPCKEKISLSLQICDAIIYLHDNNIAHNDIKPDNVLIQVQNDKFNLYLSDFGLSRYRGANFQKYTKTINESFYGTLKYTAPECLKKVNSEYQKPTAESDIWSLGALFVEFYTCEKLYEDREQIVAYKFSEEMPPSFDKLPLFVKEIFRRCLSQNPSQRSTGKELMSFFQKYADLPSSKLQNLFGTH